MLQELQFYFLALLQQMQSVGKYVVPLCLVMAGSRCMVSKRRRRPHLNLVSRLRRQAILRQVYGGQSVSKRRLGQVVGLHRNTLGHHLDQLVREGLIHIEKSSGHAWVHPARVEGPGDAVRRLDVMEARYGFRPDGGSVPVDAGPRPLHASR